MEQETDIDPREFIVNVNAADPKKTLVLKVDYFACSDDEGWCKAVSQEYEIFVERDRDAGRVAGARGGAGPGRGAGVPRPDRAQIIARMLESDADGDGKLSRKEAPARMAERFDQMDTNGDGFVDRAEIEARFKGGRPSGGGGGRPSGGGGDRQGRRPPAE